LADKNGELAVPKIPKREIVFGLRIIAFFLAPILRLMMRIRVRGLENLPKSGAYIFVSNHVTYLDPFTIAYMVYIHAKRAPHFLAKESLFRVPIFGKVITAVGQIPVYRSSGKSNEEPLRAARAFLEAGHTLLIFPEGSLTRDPELWPMRGRSGAIRLAMEAGVPIVPVAHWGDQEVLGNYSKRFRPNPFHPVDVLVGKPINIDDLLEGNLTTENVTKATERVMRRLADMVGELRGEAAPETLWDPAAKGQAVTGNFRKTKSK
jgi:1-acyl-sn-glycerol-3-phosphate acyltransferase